MIGEAASKLSEDLKSRHGAVEWRDIVKFRNIAVHAYFSVDCSIVWTTAVVDVPELLNQVQKILRDEFGA